MSAEDCVKSIPDARTILIPQHSVLSLLFADLTPEHGHLKPAPTEHPR